MKDRYTNADAESSEGPWTEIGVVPYNGRVWVVEMNRSNELRRVGLEMEQIPREEDFGDPGSVLRVRDHLKEALGDEMPGVEEVKGGSETKTVIVVLEDEPDVEEVVAFIESNDHADAIEVSEGSISLYNIVEMGEEGRAKTLDGSFPLDQAVHFREPVWEDGYVEDYQFELLVEYLIERKE